MNLVKKDRVKVKTVYESPRFQDGMHGSDMAVAEKAMSIGDEILLHVNESRNGVIYRATHTIVSVQELDALIEALQRLRETYR